MLSLLLKTIIFWSLTVQAQVDPKDALLISPSGGEDSPQSLDSSRYTSKPRKTRPKIKRRQRDLMTEANKTLSPVSDSSSESIQEQSEPTVQTSQAATSASGSQGSSKDVKQEPKNDSATPQAQQKSQKSKKNLNLVTEEGLQDRLRRILLGGDTEKIETYREYLHDQDIRKNRIEIAIAPSFIYQDNSSNYWYRRYHFGSPGLSAESRVWLTPFLGINASYQSTLGASLSAERGSPNQLSLDESWLRLGFRFRRYFGMSRKAPSISLGINYIDHQSQVPGTSEQRVSLESRGIHIEAQARLPKSIRYSWLVGMEVMPSLSHREIATAVNLTSGDRDSSLGVAFSLGGEYRLNRSNRIFWRLRHYIEKHRYEGQANIPEPNGGPQPEGVNVFQGTSFFELGYFWGI